MTPTNTQGSEQELQDLVDAKLYRFAEYIRHHERTGLGGPDNQAAINNEFLALIKSDREAHTKKIEAIVEHEYQHTTYSDMNLDSICNYDDAFEHGAEVLNKKISKRLAQLSKEDSSHA